MKKLHANLVVVRSTVAVFDNKKQEGKQGTFSTWICAFL
jgi:hypothetical protein